MARCRSVTHLFVVTGLQAHLVVGLGLDHSTYSSGGLHRSWIDHLLAAFQSGTGNDIDHQERRVAESIRILSCQPSRSLHVHVSSQSAFRRIPYSNLPSYLWCRPPDGARVSDIVRSCSSPSIRLHFLLDPYEHRRTFEILDTKSNKGLSLVDQKRQVSFLHERKRQETETDGKFSG